MMWAGGFWVSSVWCCRVYGLRWGSGRFCLKEIDSCMDLKVMEIDTRSDGSMAFTDKRQQSERLRDWVGNHWICRLVVPTRSCFTYD